jgi:hypothetical protein
MLREVNCYTVRVQVVIATRFDSRTRNRYRWRGTYSSGHGRIVAERSPSTTTPPLSDLNDHDDYDISDLRPDRLIETAVPGFPSKLALRLIRRWISVRTNSAIRICRFSDGLRDLQHLWAEMGRSGSTASAP